MAETIYTLDNEFEKLCEQLLNQGRITPIRYLELLREGRLIWEACRKKCADLCVQNGQMGIGMRIMTNGDGSMDKSWMESHRDSKE